MSSFLESAIKASAVRLSHYIEVHRGHAEVSFAEHVEQRRRDKVAHASSFKLVLTRVPERAHGNPLSPPAGEA